MTEDPAQAAPNLHFVLASRHLERIADHATNIAEDVLFWVRGLEVRHGRAKQHRSQCRERQSSRRSSRHEFSHVLIAEFNCGVRCQPFTVVSVRTERFMELPDGVSAVRASQVPEL